MQSLAPYTLCKACLQDLTGLFTSDLPIIWDANSLLAETETAAVKISDIAVRAAAASTGPLCQDCRVQHSLKLACMHASPTLTNTAHIITVRGAYSCEQRIGEDALGLTAGLEIQRIQGTRGI